MREKFITPFLIIILFQTPLFSQDKFSIPQFGAESLQFIERPLKLENNDWLNLALVSAGTILVMQADQPVRKALLEDQRYKNSFPVEAGRIWGEAYPTAIIAGVFGLHGLLADDQSTKKIGFEIVQSALYSGAITTFIKIAAGRTRPFTNRSSGTYKPFTFFDDDFHSLPSGHVTLAFSLSTVLSKNAKSDILKIGAYLPALLTAVSRIYQNNHWASDAFLGAAIGYFVGSWVTDLHEKNDSPVEALSLFPLIVRIKL